MPIIAKDNSTQYDPAPEGLHQAVCVDVIELGLLPTQWGEKEKVDIRWQLDVIDAKAGRKYIANQRYTLSLNDKATLTKHLESWRGKKFTQEEKAGFDLEKLIGVNCQIQIVHNISDQGRTYGNVQAIVPLGRGMSRIEVEGYSRAKDRKPDTAGHGEDQGGEYTDDDIPF